MKAIEIEVMCQHYMGTLQIEPVYEDHSLFSVYLKHEFLGHIQPVKKQDAVQWYSHEITDIELVNQAGDWAEYHFPLTEQSFKPIYDFKFFVQFMTGLLAVIFSRWQLTK
jgi:hypothetical protein